MAQHSLSAAPVIALHDFYLGVEAALRLRLQSAVEYDWNEDFLSRSLCEILRNHAPFRYRTFDGETAEVQIGFQKNSGKLETDRGDIGATVRITTRSGDVIVACGYLEAKRRYRKSSRYDEVRWDQLERINRNVPRAMLLLYNFEDGRFNADVSGDAFTGSAPNAGLLHSRAVVLPISLAHSIHKNTVELHPFTTPLAHEVCYRYLHGLDLEPVHTGPPQEFFARRDLDPSYRLEIHVSHRENEKVPASNAVPNDLTPSPQARATQSAEVAATRQESEEVVRYRSAGA